MALSRPVTNQQIGLFLTLKQAGVKLNVDEFDNRLILQKAVYLLQSAKVHLGYQYRWYLHGPYCSALTDDLFYLSAFAGDERAELGTYTLDAESGKNVARIRDFFAEGKGGLARHLELLASVLFLFRTGQAMPDDAHATSKVLQKAGKKYSAQDVEGAMGQLRAHELIA